MSEPLPMAMQESSVLRAGASFMQSPTVAMVARFVFFFFAEEGRQAEQGWSLWLCE
jgi:hypothetical protein